MAVTVTPYLVVKGASEAIAFYEQAFGAKETMRLAEPSGRIGHAELKIGETTIMIADEYPEMGFCGPQSLGGSPVTLVLQVADVDAVATRAVAAGATVLIAVKDQFYGERSGRIRDPFGHVWIISTHIEDVPSDELQRRYTALMTQSTST